VTTSIHYVDEGNWKSYTDLADVIASEGPGDYTFTVTAKGNELLILDAEPSELSPAKAVEPEEPPTTYEHIYVIGDAFEGWTEPTSENKNDWVELTELDGIFTWTGHIDGDKTFKFHDDTVTSFTTGNWFVASENDVAPENDVVVEGTKPVFLAGGSGNKAAWKTPSAGGKFTISLDPTALTVTFTELPEVTGITVNPNPVEVRAGSSRQFTKVVTATGGATTEVTWSVTGGTGTTVINSVTGLLTIDSTQAAGTELTVKATSNEPGYDSGSRAVVGEATVTVKEPSSEIDLALTLNDEGLTLTGLPETPPVIYKTGTTGDPSVIITVTSPGYTYTWQVDGNAPKAGTTTDNSITLNAADYTVGGHKLLLRAVNASGDPWSKIIEFTVRAR
jgi:hypothetical protein